MRLIVARLVPEFPILLSSRRAPPSSRARRRVQDIIAKAAKAERAALVNKAECHALGKEVEHLRLKLEQAVERWKEANRRRNEAESAASERCKEAEHRADSRIKEAEDAFNQLRHQLYEKIHSLEREVDAKRREGGERAAERIRTLGELGEQAQYRAVEGGRGGPEAQCCVHKEVLMRSASFFLQTWPRWS